MEPVHARRCNSVAEAVTPIPTEVRHFWATEGDNREWNSTPTAGRLREPGGDVARVT